MLATFSIGKNRSIVKEIENNGWGDVDKKIKVIIEVGLFYGDNEIENSMLDCFGHTILYLQNPKARNECKDSMKFIKDNNIRIVQG